MKPKLRVDNVENAQPENATVGTSPSVDDQVNQIDMLERQCIYEAYYDFDYDETEDNCLVVISSHQDLRMVEPVNIKLYSGNVETKALVGSGSACTIIHKSSANALVMNDKSSYWVKSSTMHDLTPFSKDIIKIVDFIITTVKCKDWTAENSKVTAVEDGL